MGCGHLTLLHVRLDPHGYASRHQWERVPVVELPWLSVGLEGGTSGLLCSDCDTEFQASETDQQLVRTGNTTLASHVGATMSLLDWARVSRDMPVEAKWPEGIGQIHSSIQGAYEQGEIGFANDPQTAWIGTALREGKAGPLRIGPHELIWGGPLKKWRYSLAELADVQFDGETLLLRSLGETEPMALTIEPVELTAHLKSGDYTVVLGAEQLARRLAARRGSVP